MWRASPRHSIHSVPWGATRISLSTLLAKPANCRCMPVCTGYPRRARAAARSATDARPRTTTAHEWSRRLTANRAVLMYRYLRRRDEVGTGPATCTRYPGGHRGIKYQ